MPRRHPPARIYTGRFVGLVEAHEEPPTPPPKDPNYVPRPRANSIASRRTSTISRSNSRTRPPISRYSSYTDNESAPSTPGVRRRPSLTIIRPGGDIPDLPSPRIGRRHVQPLPQSPRYRSRSRRETKMRVRAAASPTSPSFAPPPEPSAAVTAVFEEAIAAGNRALKLANLMKPSKEEFERIVHGPMARFQAESDSEDIEMNEPVEKAPNSPATGHETNADVQKHRNVIPANVSALGTGEESASVQPEDSKPSTGASLQLPLEGPTQLAAPSFELKVHPPSEPASETASESAVASADAAGHDEENCGTRSHAEDNDPETAKNRNMIGTTTMDPIEVTDITSTPLDWEATVSMDDTVFPNIEDQEATPEISATSSAAAEARTEEPGDSPETTQEAANDYSATDDADSDASSACSSSSLLPDQDAGKSTRSSSLTIGDYPKPQASPPKRSSTSASLHSGREGSHNITASPSIQRGRSRRSSCTSIPEKPRGWNVESRQLPVSARLAQPRDDSPVRDLDNAILDLSLTLPGFEMSKPEESDMRDESPPIDTPAVMPTRRLSKSKRLTRSSPHLRTDSEASEPPIPEIPKIPRTGRLPSLPNILKKSRNLLSPVPFTSTPPPLKRVSMHRHTVSNLSDGSDDSNGSSGNDREATTAPVVAHPVAPLSAPGLPFSNNLGCTYTVTCTSDGRHATRRKGSRSGLGFVSHSPPPMPRVRRPAASPYQPGLKVWDEDAFRRWEQEDKAATAAAQAGSGRKSSFGEFLRRGISVRKDSGDASAMPAQRSRSRTPKLQQHSELRHPGSADHKSSTSSGGSQSLGKIVVETGLEVEHKERKPSRSAAAAPELVVSSHRAASRSASRLGRK